MTIQQPPVRPGQVVEAQVTGLGHAGEGVARYQDFTLFIPGALPGDRVRVRITEVRRNFGRAGLVHVLAPAPERIAPPCPVFADCGGCQLQHLAYAAQLNAKEQQVRAALERIGKLPDVPVLPTLGMPDPWRYRNKAQFPVVQAGSRVLAGPYAGSTHRVVDVDDCLIQHPTANRVLAAVKRLAGQLGIPAYNEARHTGVLRHLLVRVAQRTGRAMLVLVTNGPDLPRRRELARALLASVPELASVWQNINPHRTNVVLGAQNRHLGGQETLVDQVGDLLFHISPASFFQVNPAQTEVLYRKALEYAGLSAGEVAIDAYCGIGTISLFLARQAGHVHGIEVVPDAVADARANAQLNAINNVEFHLGAAEMVMPALYQAGVRPAVIVFDPPRKGCEPEALAAAVAMRPGRLVYVSCNPTTMARDLAFLGASGYRTVAVQPVDMFPHTAHVECCALLTRAGNVEEVTAPEGSAAAKGNHY